VACSLPDSISGEEGAFLALAFIGAAGALIMVARWRDGNAVPFPSGEEVRTRWASKGD